MIDRTQFHTSREAEAEQQAANTSILHVAVGVATVQQALSGPGSEICIDCDQPIPEKRREAYPAATRCVRCQEGTDHKMGVGRRRIQ